MSDIIKAIEAIEFSMSFEAAETEEGRNFVASRVAKVPDVAAARAYVHQDWVELDSGSNLYSPDHRVPGNKTLMVLVDMPSAAYPPLRVVLRFKAVPLTRDTFRLKEVDV